MMIPIHIIHDGNDIPPFFLTHLEQSEIPYTVSRFDEYSDVFDTSKLSVAILFIPQLSEKQVYKIHDMDINFPALYQIIVSDSSPDEIKHLIILSNDAAKNTLPGTLDYLIKKMAARENYGNAKNIESIKTGFQQGASRLLHDVNSPLTAFYNTLEMMEISPNREKNYEKHQNILKNSVTRLREITGEWQAYLFDSPTKETAVNLLEPLKDVISYHQFLKPNVNFATAPESLNPKSYAELPEFLIRGNYFSLFQIFSHVIQNAIEAVEENEFPVVTVQLEELDNSFDILVDDNGNGINEDIRDTLWKDFIGDKEKPHWGLGMGMTRYLLMFHRGGISHADSKLGGACFRLSFHK